MKQSEIQSFWAKHTTALRSFIYAKVKNTDDTKDLLQEVFIKVYQNAEKLKTDEKAVSWVYSITRNTVYRFFQRQKEKITLDDSHLDSSENILFIEEHKTLKDLATNCFPLLTQIEANPHATVQELHQLLVNYFPSAEKIPFKYAEALILTDIKGFSQQQLADYLGISLSGAKSRVQRGREKLKELFMECCDFEFDIRGHVINYQPKKTACEVCQK